MQRGWTVLAVALAGVGCRRATAAHDAGARRAEVGAAQADSGRDAGVDVSRPRTALRRPTRGDGGTAVQGDGGAAARTSVPPAVRTAVATDGPRVLVPTPGGAMLVRAVNHDGRRQSELVATLFDPDGRVVGAPRLLRRTTGPVVDVDASARGGWAWVAWATQRLPETAVPEGERDTEEDILAAVRMSADLSTIERPVTLADFRRPRGGETPYVWEFPSVMVAAQDDGSTSVVATGPGGTCEHSEGPDHTERVSCPGWLEGSVSAAGVRSLTTTTTLCPPNPPYGLRRIPGGYVYVFTDEHPGTKQNIVVQSPQALGLEETFWDHGDVRLAWTGSELVSVQTLDAQMFDLPEQDTVRVATLSGSARTPTHTLSGIDVYPQVTHTRVRCAGGHPTVTIEWSGGSVVLDPSAPDASMNLGDWIAAGTLPLPPATDAGRDREGPIAWAGRALVGLVDEVPVRWVCTPSGALRLAR